MAQLVLHRQAAHHHHNPDQLYKPPLLHPRRIVHRCHSPDRLCRLLLVLRYLVSRHHRNLGHLGMGLRYQE